MADAIDNSEIVCYCLSQEYKESANCKLEALYGTLNQMVAHGLLSPCLSVCLSVSLSLSVCLSVSLSLCVAVDVSLCMPYPLGDF